jgi:hypothetical protein
MRGSEIDIMLNWWDEKRGRVKKKKRSGLIRKLRDGT